MSHASSSSESTRNFVTTSEDHSGIALTVCTLLTTWTVLCYIIRVSSRLVAKSSFEIDDFGTGIATIFALTQAVVSGFAISNGFGKSLKLLSDDNIIKVEKVRASAIYAAQLLFIATNAAAKCSAASVISRLAYIKTKVRVCQGLMAVSAIWALASLLAQAVRCTSVSPWQIIPESCPQVLHSWRAIVAFDVTIEAALFALPFLRVWDLQTDVRRKAIIIFAFGLRLPVIAVAIARLHYYAKAIGSDQPFLLGVTPFICLNVEMHYGIVAVTIPTLKPFVGSFNIGWGTYDTQGISGYGATGHPESYAMKSLRSGGGERSGDHIPKLFDRDEGVTQFQRGKNTTVVKARSALPSQRNSDDTDGSRQMIIKQTTTYGVSYEEACTERSGPGDIDLVAGEGTHGADQRRSD